MPITITNIQQFEENNIAIKLWIISGKKCYKLWIFM